MPMPKPMPKHHMSTVCENAKMRGYENCIPLPTTTTTTTATAAAVTTNNSNGSSNNKQQHQQQACD